jgi:hypothetical protein
MLRVAVNVFDAEKDPNLIGRVILTANFF